MFGVDSISMVVGGLFAGMIFGFLLQKGQVAKYAVIVGQFLFVDYTVLKVMFTAIFVGAVGVYGMLAAGLIDGLLVKPAMLAANAVGGLVFGVGMSSLGYCPGTGVAALAEGSRHAGFGILGMLFGAAIFAEAYSALDAGFNQIGSLGKVTLSDVSGLSPWVFVGAFGLICGVVFTLIRRWESKQQAA